MRLYLGIVIAAQKGYNRSYEADYPIPPREKRSFKIAELLDKYELDKQLDDNGRTIVYLAHDAQRQVILKVLTPHRRSPENIVRLTREAQTIGALQDPRVPRVYESGQVEDYCYIALEHSEGKSLADLLEERRRVPFDLETTLRIIGQVAEVLDAAHAKGIIHGNLKPDDILITGDQDVRLFGFGETDPLPGVATETRTAAARYMAPEQFEEEGSVDQRADVYALGVLLYEMLTGYPPFDANLMTTLTYSVLRGNPRVPTVLNPQVPESVEEVILKAMARRKEERYPTVQALTDALRQAVSEIPPEERSAISKAPPSVRPASAPSRVPTPVPALEPAGSPASTELPRRLPRRYIQRLRQRRGSPWEFWTLLVAAAAVIAAIALGLMASSASSRSRLMTSVPSPALTPTDTATPTETMAPTDVDRPVEVATDTPVATPSPSATATDTRTPHPKQTLKARGTSTPTPRPTRTKIVIPPTATPPPTDTPPPTPTPIRYPAGNLLRNAQFEEGFSVRGALEVAIAEGWHPWWQEGPGQEEGYNRRPEYKPEDAEIYGTRRVRSGRFSQKYFNTYATHNAGIFQQVNVVPGGHCTFSIWVQVWSSQDSNPDTVVEPGHYRVAVGIDPYGGTDWRSANIVWSEPRVDYNVWMQLSVSAIVQRDIVTVFVRGFPEYRVKFNDSYWDDAELREEAP